MTIKAITFDFWSTLYRGKTIDFSQRLLRLKTAIEQSSGVTVQFEQLQAAVELARDTWNRTWVEQYRTMDAADWLRVILNELALSLAANDFDQIQTKMETSVLHELPTLVPEAREVLAALAADHKLALISDTGITPGRVLRQILEKDDIVGYFSQLTFSDEVGRSKPHPDAFLTTLYTLGARPSQAVHVGDLLRTDIAGAQRVNMRAVQYVGINYDQGASTLNSQDTMITPDAVIENHAELLTLLPQWHNGIKPGGLS